MELHIEIELRESGEEGLSSQLQEMSLVLSLYALQVPEMGIGGSSSLDVIVTQMATSGWKSAFRYLTM